MPSSRPSTGEPLACPSCARRYRLEERFCVQCGMPLIYAGPASAEAPRDAAHERARKIRPEYARGELVRVAGARNQAEAEMIQGLLIEEGIPSALRRSAGFDVPDFLAAGPRDVLVPDSGSEAARGLLHDSGAPAPGERGEPATTGQALRLGGAITAGGALAALIAWALLHLSG